MTAPTSPALAVQTAIYTALTGDQQLMDLLSGEGVYDWVDGDPAYPYVVIGEALETPDNTHSGYGRQTPVTLHVWSRYRGYKQALEIAQRIIQVLDHQPLAVAGHHHVVTRYEFMQTLTDPDPSGQIRHVPIRFRVITEQPRT